MGTVASTPPTRLSVALTMPPTRPRTPPRSPPSSPPLVCVGGCLYWMITSTEPLPDRPRNSGASFEESAESNAVSSSAAVHTFVRIIRLSLYWQYDGTLVLILKRLQTLAAREST